MRRFAEIGGMRRAIRDGAGAVRRGASQRPPLPASAVEYWHSELQCTPSAWVGQLRGSSLPGNGTPIVAVDPGFFGGRVAAQAALSGKFWASATLPALATTGTRPWLYAVGRLRTTAEATAVVVGAGGTTALASLVLTSPVLVVGFNNGTTQVGSPPADTNVHRWKFGADGVNANLIQDDTAYTTPYAGSLPENCVAFAVGANPAGFNFPCNCSLVFALICSSQPTPAEFAALDAWAMAYWGIPSQRPPLPASAVEYWHSELGVSLVGGAVDAWTGQIAGTAVSAVGPTNRPTYGADATNFNGRQVVQCVGATNANLRNPTPANLITVGQRPWLMSVFRTRAAQGTVSVIDIGIASVVNSHSLAFNTSNFLGFYQNSAVQTPTVQSSVPFGTAARVAMAWSDGANANITVSGTNTSAPFTAAVTDNTTGIGIGRTAGGAWPWDTSHAFHLLCSSKPPAPEIAALVAWAQAYWGAT